jgi:hypothetical protein
MGLPDKRPPDPDSFSKRQWAEVPEAVRKDVEQHVSANLLDDLLAKLRELHASRLPISRDDAFFHFAGGMVVRNHRQLSEYGLFGGWDDCGHCGGAPVVLRSWAGWWISRSRGRVPRGSQAARAGRAAHRSLRHCGYRTLTPADVGVASRGERIERIIDRDLRRRRQRARGPSFKLKPHRGGQ